MATTTARSFSGSTLHVLNDVVGTEAVFLKKEIAARVGVNLADFELVIEGESEALRNGGVPFPTPDDVLPLTLVMRGST